MTRCAWVNLKNPLYVKYHDEEWGWRPKSDRLLYELFILETFQAGLSWECVLNKREAIRAAFEGFDPEKVAAYDEHEIERLMVTEGIIHNRAKLSAAVSNSKVYLALSAEFGSFGRYIESFVGTKPIDEPYTERTTSPLSDALSKDMKRLGMKFVGSTTVYSFLQAAGYIDAHGPECELC